MVRLYPLQDGGSTPCDGPRTTQLPLSTSLAGPPITGTEGPRRGRGSGVRVLGPVVSAGSAPDRRSPRRLAVASCGLWAVGHREDGPHGGPYNRGSVPARRDPAGPPPAPLSHPRFLLSVFCFLFFAFCSAPSLRPSVPSSINPPALPRTCPRTARRCGQTERGNRRRSAAG